MTKEANLTDSSRASLTHTLAGRRILIVEDEPLVAISLEDMLLELGCVVIGPAMRLHTAIKLAKEEMLDAAVLDVNLNEDRSFVVAEILEARGIPFLFATGYGNLGLDPPFEDAPVLAKPYRHVSLQQSLSSIL